MKKPLGTKKRLRKIQESDDEENYFGSAQKTVQEPAAEQNLFDSNADEDSENKSIGAIQREMAELEAQLREVNGEQSSVIKSTPTKNKRDQK